MAWMVLIIIVPIIMVEEVHKLPVVLLVQVVTTELQVPSDKAVVVHTEAPVMVVTKLVALVAAAGMAAVVLLLIVVIVHLIGELVVAAQAMLILPLQQVTIQVGAFSLDSTIPRFTSITSNRSFKAFSKSFLLSNRHPARYTYAVPIPFPVAENGPVTQLQCVSVY